jgi:integrase
MLLRTLLSDEYAPLRALKPRAHRQYELTLDRWAEHLGREPAVADLSGLPVQAFLQARRKTVSQATCVKDRCHIVALWGFAFNARMCERHPKAMLPRMTAPRRIPKAYRLDEVSSMVRVARALPGAICGVPRGLYMASLIRIAWETAERVGAIRLVEWSDVDLEERAIVFRAENRKGGAADNRREISEELAGWLKKMRQPGQRLVWPWDGSETGLWYEFGKLCAVCGVTARGFHGFRRSSASYLAAAGGSAAAAQEHLTHDSVSTTRAHYLDPSIFRPRLSAVQMLPALDLGDAEFVEDEDAA